MQKATGIVMLCALTSLLGISQAEPAPSTKPKPAPAPAEQLMASAQLRAAKEKKAVLVMFHASWCGWCHKLTDVMEMPKHKKLFTDNYVIVSLDVSEQGAQKALENPGATEVMADLGGAQSGLPFYAVVNSKGKQLASSNAVPGPNGEMENIGYPAAPREIAAFDGLLKKTAPKMNVAARTALITYLTETSPQRPNPGH